ncbi:terminase small subunit [Pseudomonas phage phi15]|uniref:Putative DNA packaging/maturation protein A n=1 Tax=Pseudomonas phage phi15 TaxID=988656 RepID=F0V707_9CAUD|nr:terminase small subunit [Pseudomonas phage phi15]CBZ42019.1 putative DNA packaging/maturation protein A [Pseudomonas phage phi15]
MAKRADILQYLLELIDTEMAHALLNDLRSEEKRCPQLYNAVDKFLSRHKFALASIMAEKEDLGELQAALEQFKELGLGDLEGETIQ